MKPEDINWDKIPKQYDRVVQGVLHVWAMNDNERYILELGKDRDWSPAVYVGLTVRNRGWEYKHVIATRPVEDKAEYWVKRKADGGYTGPFTRDVAIERAGRCAKLHTVTYTIVRIIPVLEVSVGDVIVKEL